LNFVRFLGILCITLFLKKYFSTEIGFHLPGPPFYFWFIVTVWRLPVRFKSLIHLFTTNFHILLSPSAAPRLRGRLLACVYY
jgi:hypothetical protein